MASVRLSFTPEAGLLASELPLRMIRASGVVDPEPFRRRSVEGPLLSEPFSPSAGFRALHLRPGQQADLFDAPKSSLSGSHLLSFVVSGVLEIALSAGEPLHLLPGDLFLVEAEAAPHIAASPQGDFRLLQLPVEPDWPGERARAVPDVLRGSRPGDTCNFKRMVKGADERSTFHPFNNLFGPAGAWSKLTPLIGFRFIGMAEDTFIDWHPEIVNNLVIVLSGGLELEVGGGGGSVEVFYPGDVCLAQDRTGEGHIDRMHGYVQVAVLIVEDDDLWPLSAE